MAPLFSMLNSVCLFLNVLKYPAKLKVETFQKSSFLYGPTSIQETLCETVCGHLLFWFRCFCPSFGGHGSSKEKAGLAPQAFLPSISQVLVSEHIASHDSQPLCQVPTPKCSLSFRRSKQSSVTEAQFRFSNRNHC